MIHCSHQSINIIVRIKGPKYDFISKQKKPADYMTFSAIHSAGFVMMEAYDYATQYIARNTSTHFLQAAAHCLQ